MANQDYSATNAEGVNFALTYNPFLGTYDLLITNPDLSTLSITGIPQDNVLIPTTGSTSLTIVSLLGNQAYVVPPGVTGTVTVGVGLVTSNTLYVGGSATFGSLAGVLSNLVVDVDGGTVTAGTFISALSNTVVNLDNGGVFNAGTDLASVLSGTTINFGTEGGTLDANAGGVVLNLSSTTITGFDAGDDDINFADLAAPVTSYSITDGAAGAQTVTLYSSDNIAQASFTVTGSNLPTGVVSEGHSGPLTITLNGTSVTVEVGASVLPCFLSGTRILTPNGEVAVEALHQGDLVITADGRSVPITWIGASTISGTCADHARLTPIRFRAGSLGTNVPSSDLYVSPDHAMYLSEVLIPAQLLVNGTTITQPRYADNLDYYHVEVEPHDLLVAEGAATESFLNTGSREQLLKGALTRLLQIEEAKTWEDACAPLVLGGAKLAFVRAQLDELARMSETGPLAARAA